MTEKSALDVLTTELTRLRKLLSAKADTAYHERDAEGVSDRARAYAEGEGHAYGIASDEARAAVADEDDATGQTGAEPERRSG